MKHSAVYDNFINLQITRFNCISRLLKKSEIIFFLNEKILILLFQKTI